MTRANDPAPLRVLQTQRRYSRTSRYDLQVTAEAPPEVVQLDFTWPRALFGRYDLVHAHWPEYLARHRVAPARHVKRFLFARWIARLEKRGTPVVRTLHNLRPHEPGDAGERRLLERFDRLTALRVKLNPFTPAPGPLPTVTIPLGHYADRFANLPQPEPVPGRLLHVGELKPYKGVDRLVEEFRAHPDDSLTLRIVGRPAAPGLRERLAAAEAADTRITSLLGEVSDAVMVEEIARSELVVLPYLQMHNSAVVMVALSIDRPVVVPDNEVNRWLADEIGPGWIHMFEPPFTMNDAVTALAAARARPAGAKPAFVGRDWKTHAALHAEAYLDLMAGRGDG